MGQGTLPRPTIPLPQNEEAGAVGGKAPLPPSAQLPADSALTVKGPAAPTGVGATPGSTFERAGGKGGPPSPQGSAINVPRSLQGSKMVASALEFAKNASPQMMTNCTALGKFISANPDKALQMSTALLDAQKLDNGEVVMTAPGFQDAPATPPTPPPGTPATDAGGAQSTEAGGAQTAKSSSEPSTEAGGALTGTGGSGGSPDSSEAGGFLTGSGGGGGGGGAYGITPVSGSSNDAAIQNMGVLPPGCDIASMCFMVLMEATNDQDKDLEMIMAETKAQTKTKQAMRDVISKVGKDTAGNAAQQINDANGNPFSDGPHPPSSYPGTAGQGSTDGSFYTGSAAIPVANPNAAGGYDAVNTVLWTKSGADGNATGPNYTELKSIQDDLKGRLDSMNEMSEMTSMRLQMAMDRRSKFVEALSNIMKKIDSTQETIVQNLK